MLTPFFLYLQSVGQAADGDWAGAGLEGRMKDIEPLGQDGHRNRLRLKSASYILDFVSFS